MGEQSRPPFYPSLSSRSPSFLLDISRRDSRIPDTLSAAPKRRSTSRPYEQAAGLETLIVVRDPPREHLAAFHSPTEHKEFPPLVSFNRFESIWPSSGSSKGDLVRPQLILAAHEGVAMASLRHAYVHMFSRCSPGSSGYIANKHRSSLFPYVSDRC